MNLKKSVEWVAADQLADGDEYTPEHAQLRLLAFQFKKPVEEIESYVSAVRKQREAEAVLAKMKGKP